MVLLRAFLLFCAAALVSAAAPPLPEDGHRALREAVRKGNLEAAKDALNAIFRASNNPAARSEALLEAAGIAARAGDMPLAHAYLDWGQEEARRAGDVLTAKSLSSEAIMLTAEAGDRAGAVERAREHARSHDDVIDLGPEARAIGFDGYPLQCPDVLEWQYVRVSMDKGDARFGPLRPVRCRYVPLTRDTELAAIEVEHRIDPSTRRERIVAITQAREPDRRLGFVDPGLGLSLMSADAGRIRLPGRDVWLAKAHWGRKGQDAGFIEAALIVSEGEERTIITTRFVDDRTDKAATEACMVAMLSSLRPDLN